MAVISKENRKKFVDLLDELTKFKNPFLEGVDGWIYSIVVGALDDNFLVKVKPEFHPLIDKMAGQLGDKDFEGAGETLGEILAMAIKTPLIDGTPAELELYANVFKLIAQLIQTWIEKKNAEVAPA